MVMARKRFAPNLRTLHLPIMTATRAPAELPASGVPAWITPASRSRVATPRWYGKRSPAGENENPSAT